MAASGFVLSFILRTAEIFQWPKRRREARERRRESHAQVQRNLAAWCSEALALPISDADRRELERLRDLTNCQVCVHLPDSDLSDRIDVLKAQLESRAPLMTQHLSSL